MKTKTQLFAADISMHIGVCDCVFVCVQMCACPLVICEAVAVLEQNFAEAVMINFFCIAG